MNIDYSKIISKLPNDFFEKAIKLKPVISYTTRPIRINETDGVEHYFITDEEAEYKLKNESILAKTEINGYKYFATIESLAESGCNLYIIDPIGVDSLKSNYKNLKTKTIYLHIDPEERKNRALQRGDSLDILESRFEKENKQFESFENNKSGIDLLLENNDIEKTLYYFLLFLYSTYTKDTLYLIVGRSGSGKDTVVTNVINILTNFNVNK